MIDSVTEGENMRLKNRVALVTGASSGIGKSTVEKLLASGATVYAAARRVNEMGDLEKVGATVISLDITDDASIVSVVNTIMSTEGHLDILINNAGYGSYGAIEDVPVEEGRRQFEVNIFGLARLTQLVLPGMRKNHFGKIVNISSMGGKMYTPFGGWYHATKHALEGFSDCLRLETAPFGIDVIIVEPGGIATSWGSIAANNLRKTSGNGAYASTAHANADRMEKLYASGKLTDPSVIASVIVKAVSVKKPKTRYVAGYMAAPSLLLRKIVSDRLFDAIIKAMM